MVGAYIFAVTGPVTGPKYRMALEPAPDIFLVAVLLWTVIIGGVFVNWTKPRSTLRRLARNSRHQNHRTVFVALRGETT